jgi:hypothetical protein
MYTLKLKGEEGRSPVATKSEDRLNLLELRLTTRLDRIAEAQEVNTEQIGRLTESITQLQHLIETSTQRQDRQIDRLLGVVERLTEHLSTK